MHINLRKNGEKGETYAKYCYVPLCKRDRE